MSMVEPPRPSRPPPMGPPGSPLASRAKRTGSHQRAISEIGTWCRHPRLHIHKLLSFQFTLLHPSRAVKQRQKEKRPQIEVRLHEVEGRVGPEVGELQEESRQREADHQGWEC